MRAIFAGSRLDAGVAALAGGVAVTGKDGRYEKGATQPLKSSIEFIKVRLYNNCITPQGVGRVGFEPTRSYPADFRTTMTFVTGSQIDHYFDHCCEAVCSLDFLLTLHVQRRSLPSSLYTFFLHSLPVSAEA
jgi:hypothetical protein